MIRAFAASAAAIVGASLLYGLASCGPGPTSCIARGAATSSGGAATYALAPPGEPSVKGTVETNVVVYDLTPGCWYSSMEFRVVIGSCSLWVQAPTDAAADEPEGGGDAGFVSSAVEPGATCELPISEGLVTVSGLTGTLVVGSSVRLELSGRLSGVGDSGVSNPGSFSWSFVGGLEGIPR